MKVFENSADEVFAQKMTENPFYGSSAGSLLRQ
jgi:hypothetical protein